MFIIISIPSIVIAQESDNDFDLTFNISLESILSINSQINPNTGMKAINAGLSLNMPINSRITQQLSLSVGMNFINEYGCSIRYHSMLVDLNYRFFYNLLNNNSIQLGPMISTSIRINRSLNDINGSVIFRPSMFIGIKISYSIFLGLEIGASYSYTIGSNVYNPVPYIRFGFWINL